MKDNELKKLEKLIDKIDALLKEEGFKNLKVQNFKMQNTATRTCLKWKLVKRSDGTVYKKCIVRSND